MKGLNKVLLLGKDPEVSTLEGNIKVAKFALASSESFKDERGKSIPRQNGTILCY